MARRSYGTGCLFARKDSRGVRPGTRSSAPTDARCRRYVQHLTALGRRRSTLQDYGSFLRVHLVPFFGDLALDKIGRTDVEDFIAEKLADGLAPKSVRNYLGLLHSLFAYAEKQEWTRGNPCKLVDKPGDGEADADIRFLMKANWRRIDWTASRVRVRQNYVRGEFGRPKSKRSTRSVPLADPVAGELDCHFQASPFQADDDLVFCNPRAGNLSRAAPS